MCINNFFVAVYEQFLNGFHKLTIQTRIKNCELFEEAEEKHGKHEEESSELT